MRSVFNTLYLLLFVHVSRTWLYPSREITLERFQISKSYRELPVKLSVTFPARLAV